MISLQAGPLQLRISHDPQDRTAALALRGQAYRQGRPDEDSHDAGAAHLVIRAEGQPRLAARLQLHMAPGAAQDGYAGQSYDLSPLSRLGGPLVEFGRLCLAPGGGAAELRLAFAGLTCAVDRIGAAALFGCVSLPGAEPRPHLPVLRGLWPRHAPPQGHSAPRALATGALDLSRLPEDGPRHPPPPLLAAYLDLQAWIGPDFVADPDLGTSHLLIVLETARVPEARARRLRQMAGLWA